MRDIFDVTISKANNNRVSSLAEAIRTRRLDRFQDIDSTRLALYKVGFISDSVVIHNLSNNEYFEVDGAIRMEPQDTMFSHFPTQPKLIYGGEKGINVIVYPHFLFVSCSDIVAIFMYCKPTNYFINKVLFYQYIEH